MDPTIQGSIAVAIGILLFVMGYWKGKNDGALSAVDTLIAMRILKITPEGNIVRGDRLDLE